MWKQKIAYMEQGFRKRREEQGRERAGAGLPVDGARLQKKCPGNNLTQAFSTSTLRGSFLMPKKELNHSADLFILFYFFYKPAMPVKNSKFWTVNILIFVTVKFLY